MVNSRGLHLEYARLLHEEFLMSLLMYGSETMIWKVKERSRIRFVQMENLRGLPAIKRKDKVPIAWIREMCGVTTGMDERIDESVLH